MTDQQNEQQTCRYEKLLDLMTEYDELNENLKRKLFNKDYIKSLDNLISVFEEQNSILRNNIDSLK